MRLGLLTFHAAHNYGAVLQAYGLQAELQRMGHEPRFVHYYSDELEARNRYRRPVRRPADLAARLAYLAFSLPLRRRFRRFESFQQNQLQLTERFATVHALESKKNWDFDAFVCGSDQIWNFTNGLSPVYFLRFVDSETPGIAYAPSFGKAVDPDQAPAELGPWIDRFQFLSAREDCGVELIRRLTGRDAPQVLDPAFFLDGASWGALAAPPPIEEDYLLFYALETNARTDAVVRAVAERLGVRIVVAGKGGGFLFKNRTKLAIDSGPSEFLGLIRNARCVVSNSFHATVFSLLFGVPFVTVGHSTRNARMESLLQTVGMADRLVTDGGDLDALDDPFDPAALSGVGTTLLPAVQRSRDFLRTSLAEIEGGRCPAAG